MSLTKGLYAIFGHEMKGFSKIWHHIIKISAEVLAPGGTGVNNGKFHSLVQPHDNIPPIITQLMVILNIEVEGYQNNLVVGK